MLSSTRSWTVRRAARVSETSHMGFFMAQVCQRVRDFWTSDSRSSGSIFISKTDTQRPLEQQKNHTKTYQEEDP